MSRISDRLLKSVVFIYSSEEAAINQEEDGGTGFIYGVELIDNLYALYLVTNRHIVKTNEGTQDRYFQVNTKDGKSEIIPAKSDSWVFHPDGLDIAISLLNLNPEIHDIGFVRRGPDAALKQDVDRFNFGPGDEAFMVGRFVSIENSNSVLPIVRYGHISSMPIAVTHPISGLNEESYLVDMHSRRGFSGSPVFVQFSMRFEKRDSKSSGPWSGERLLGINWGARQDEIKIIDKDRPKNKAYAKIFSNLNYVSPVWNIDHVLDSEEFQRQREEVGKEIIGEGNEEA